MSETTKNPVQLGEYHSHDGLCFRRNDDGSVRVQVRDALNWTGAPVFDITLPPEVWESVLRETAWAAIHNRPTDPTPAGQP